VKLVVDHIRGTRRGQREVIEEVERVTFGRHPNNDVVFDAQGDIEASSRHAEIRRDGKDFVFLDVGSSNGSWVDAERVESCSLRPEHAVVVEFGRGGPTLSLWLGEQLSTAPAPQPPPRRSLWRRLWPSRS
jgi:pSer/pThr/pTyr-binding forkhead associated (FHA) protein